MITPCDLATPRFCPRCGINEPCRRLPPLIKCTDRPEAKLIPIKIPNRLHGAAINAEGCAI